MYNIATDGLNKNEMSRFLRQLLAETDFPVELKILQSGQAVPADNGMEAAKTPEVMDILRRNYGSGQPGSRPLSPSALNAYIDCPLKFITNRWHAYGNPKTRKTVWTTHCSAPSSMRRRNSSTGN